MSKWLVKAAFQGAASLVPGAEKLNYLCRKHVTRSLDMDAAHFEQKLQLCNRHLATFLRWAENPGSDFTALELGTGRYPVLPIGLFLCGASTVCTIDKLALLDEESVVRSFQFFIRYFDNGKLVRFLPRVRSERMAQLKHTLASAASKSAHEMLRPLGIDFLVHDARRTTLSNASVDFIFSNVVLRDIPRPVLNDIFREFHRVAKPNSVMSHHVSLEDHYADFDDSISVYNFLQYSDSEWKLFNNSLHYQNRLRICDYRRLHAEAGFEILQEDKQTGPTEVLARMRIAKEFQNCSFEDLASSRAWIASQPAPAAPKARMRALLSAYACEPGRGSEPGVGWNWARQLSQSQDVWVITRANNRAPIEKELERNPLPNAHFVYYDLPRWMRFWKRGSWGLRTYYYLWQLGAFLHARRLNQRVHFHFVQHVTFVKYWMPSFLSLLPVPFVWGPVGGGESTPPGFWHSFSRRGKIYESLRGLARRIGELDPFVRLTARRSVLTLVTTQETEERVSALGCRNVRICSEAGLSSAEIQKLAFLRPRRGKTFRVLSIGNLLHLKGFELGLRAFADFLKGGAEGEYWLLGEGPEQERLEKLATNLGISKSVSFLGHVPRAEVLRRLADCDVLLHPSLHDSGGWVCLEAMAAGRTVLCLNTGGPALQVTEATGVKIPATSPEQVVRDLSAALQRIFDDPELRVRIGEAARQRVAEHFCWEKKPELVFGMFQAAVRSGIPAREAC